MRLYIKLSQNKEAIPFNYQHLLTGCIHKWLGEDNAEHGKRSLYSFSWLQNTRGSSKGLNLSSTSYFFISAYEQELIKRILKGILTDPTTFYGSEVIDVQMKEIPEFSTEERFVLKSPVLIRKREGGKTKHVTFSDDDFEELLTANLKKKLKDSLITDDNVSVSLDKTYAFPQTKLINYKGIQNKATLAPVIIKGSPEQISFAWLVGLGESTGIGFGALK